METYQCHLPYIPGSTTHAPSTRWTSLKGKQPSPEPRKPAPKRKETLHDVLAEMEQAYRRQNRRTPPRVQVWHHDAELMPNAPQKPSSKQ